MLSRGVAVRLRRYGPDYPLAGVAAYLRGADLVFGNLECTLQAGPPVPRHALQFRAAPREAAALAAAGFTVLSLANNHSPNYGPAGLRATFAALDAAGLAYVGAGPDRAAARRPAVIVRRGIRFAFLAYAEGDIVPAGYAAGPRRAGVAFMNLQTLAGDVARARAAADIVIVSMHAGREYQPRPDAEQIAFAHAAIAAGADAVIGHHPHVVQTMEWYRGKPIFYSLGNFIFDQSWSQPTRLGLAVELTFTRAGLVAWRPQPVRIMDAAQPRLLSGPAAAAVLARLGPGARWAP